MMRFCLVIVLAALLSGCSRLKYPQSIESAGPTLAAKTKIGEMLFNLPPAGRRVTLSVYEFNDLTGQNKPGDTPQYSRAVTQGGLAILKKALLDASNHRWFRVLERGGLENLLKERQIIRSMRSNYRSADGKKLGPLSALLYSGILLEGGIVAYESNLATGGAGARYLGIGGSTQYRRDMVTVYLSASSVSTGEVLLSVNTSKTIYSKGTSGGLFYYVTFDKIAEMESGYTVNEPPQLAVRQAIEMAVYAMIMEGYERHLWSFADPQAGRDVYERYARGYKIAAGDKREEQEREEKKPVSREQISKNTIQRSKHSVVEKSTHGVPSKASHHITPDAAGRAVPVRTIYPRLPGFAPPGFSEYIKNNL